MLPISVTIKTYEPTANQAISYLLVVWVLYSPLFPIIALPWWQVDRECFCSWSVHLLSDRRNIFVIAALLNRYASVTCSVFILSCRMKRLFKPLASIAHWPAKPSPRLIILQAIYTGRDQLQRCRYNKQNWVHCKRARRFEALRLKKKLVTKCNS